MTRQMYVAAFLLFLPILLFAQPPGVLWTRTLPDLDGSQMFDSVVHAPDGSIYAWSRTYVGTTDPSYLYKFDADGQVEWCQVFDGDPLVLERGMIALDDGNGVFVCGTSNHDVTLIHVDGDGTVLSTSWDPTWDLDAHVMAITRLADGRVAVASEAERGAAQGVGVSIFSNDGEFQYTTVHDLNSSSADVESIIQLLDGTLVIGGRDSWDDSAYLLRVDTEGNTLWYNEYFGGSVPRLYDLVALPNGNLALCGDLTGYWIAEITPEGYTAWESIDQVAGYDVEVMPSGGLVFTFGLLIVHTDNQGHPVWSKTINGLPNGLEFRGACVTENGGVITAGGSRLADTLLLNRLDDTSPPALTLTLIPQGSTVVPSSGGTLYFDARVQLNLPTPVSGERWKMVRLPNGQVFGPLVLRSINIQPGESYYDGGQLVVPPFAPAGFFQLIGNLGIYPDFIGASDILYFTKEEGSSANSAVDFADFTLVSPEALSEPEFVAQESEGTPLPETAALGELYPNPTNGTSSLTVTLPEPGELRAELFDVTGRFIGTAFEGTVSAGKQSIAVETDDLASGTYLLRVSVRGQLEQTRRLVLLK